MNVLVLGGYGLIGAAVVAKLVRDGHRVTGLGRDVSRARRRWPGAAWVEADLRDLVAPEAWKPLLAGVEAVVNAAGALQDGARDDLQAVHHHSIRALVAACEAGHVGRFVQISATGVGEGGSEFFRTKAEGDAALTGSTLAWTILRPGLVIAPAAYGGTALLRALAAFPFAMPAVLADRPLQTVYVGDVADAVSLALAGRVPFRRSFDLVEDEPRPLGDVLRAFRAWLGLPPAPVLKLPDWFGRAAGWGADMLGRLGWRSPLRSTAMAAIAGGVTGDAGSWRDATGLRLRSLEQTLRDMPAHAQERWFARLWLLKPLMVGTLSLFWMASGIVGLVSHDAATEVLTSRGVAAAPAQLAVVAGSVADGLLGAAVLVRRWAHGALIGMLALTSAYLAGASWLAPDLWLDPLGPLVKVVPALVLALAALAVLDER